MDIAEKTARFGRIAEDAHEFQFKQWNRLLQRLWLRLVVSWVFGSGEVWKLVWRHARWKQDLFEMDTPPEISALVRDEMTAADLQSPYAPITLARFSMPELAKYTNRELALDLEQLEAIELIVESRKEGLAESPGKTFLVIAIAVLSWFCSDIPDAVFAQWNVNQAVFTTIAFYVGVAAVVIGLAAVALELFSKSRAERQARLFGRLIAHCRAQLKAGSLG